MQRLSEERALKASEASLRSKAEQGESTRTSERAAERIARVFLTQTAHEMKSPVAGQLRALNELLDPVGGLLLPLQILIPPQANEIFDSMHRRMKHLSRLIDDLNSLGQLQFGGFLLKPHPCVIRKLLVETVLLVDSVARQNGNTLLVICDARVPEGVRCDATRLSQCIINLVTNASKYTHDGVIVVRCGLLRQDGNHVELFFSVADTGGGIQLNKVGDLCHPFVRSDASMDNIGSHDEELRMMFRSSGLGLTITRHLIRRLGGFIYVRTHPGVGSEFAFTVAMTTTELPRVKSNHTIPMGRTESNSPSPGSGTTCSPFLFPQALTPTITHELRHHMLVDFDKTRTYVPTAMFSDCDPCQSL
jgi:signal transduction histidine kinase